MFLYEKNNSINVCFTNRQLPCGTADLSIVGYQDGSKLLIDGAEVAGKGTLAFDDANHCATLAFERDNKICVTFNGVKGMENPSVTIDEIVKFDNSGDEVVMGKAEIVVDGDVVVLTFDDKDIAVDGEQPAPVADEPTPVEEPVEKVEETEEDEQEDITEE